MPLALFADKCFHAKITFVVLLSFAFTDVGSLRLDIDIDTQKLKYLSLVYNENVTNVSIFDDISMIYRNASVPFPPVRIPCITFVHGYDCTTFFNQNCLGGKTHLGPRPLPEYVAKDLSLVSEVVWPSPKHVVKSHEWLEVTRRAAAVEGQQYGGACMFTVRKGSGVFVNVLKTMVVHKAAGTTKLCPKARRLGYDTVQVVETMNDRGSNELLYCRGTCATSHVNTTCIPELELRTGVNHDKQCVCDESFPLLNCGNGIAPPAATKEQLTSLCDQKWFRAEVTKPSVDWTFEYAAFRNFSHHQTHQRRQ